jgi:release factor glutamine methyltransferase
MTTREANKQVALQLQAIYDRREALNISDLVMESLTGKKKTERVINQETELSLEQTRQLKIIMDRLLQNEPIQYILNEAWFYNLKLTVDKNVLIPRPETEELVEWILQSIGNRQFAIGKNIRILDVGTGSGCIPIALRKNLSSQFEVWACDINDQALTVARKNADDHKALVDFVAMDFLDAAQRKQLPHVDFIVSNPPYVPLRDKDQMKRNVTRYEPGIALYVPDDNPLIFYEAIADFGKEKLYENGQIFVEIHESLGPRVVELFRSKSYSAVELRKDMQGKDRMVRIEL